jgi:hypothetical protein
MSRERGGLPLRFDRVDAYYRKHEHADSERTSAEVK